jgi:quinoprotein glucose dehydrogenase
MRAQQRRQTPDVEWTYIHGDKKATKYSPLDQITRDNVKHLCILWRLAGIDGRFKQAFPDLNPSNNLRSTPIMAGGVLFASNAVGLVEAFDPGTGETLWVQQPIEPGMPGMAGQPTRGVAYWSSGGNPAGLLDAR